MENNQKENLMLIKDLGMHFSTEKSKQKVRFGLYKCNCNNEFRARTADVKLGKIKSCGCLNRKLLIKRNTTHGLNNHRLNGIWQDIKKRCLNKNRKQYVDYGGRGITICDEWLNDFISFYNWALDNGYQDNLTIDRINNDGNYEPLNCRWTTRTVQARNTRRLSSKNTSGYRGVLWDKRKNKWNAFISINNKRIHLGYFNTDIEAVLARDKYIDDNKLEHTKNF